MRRAASWTHPRQVRSGPRGARTRRAPAGAGAVAVAVVTADPPWGRGRPGCHVAVRPARRRHRYYNPMSTDSRTGTALELGGDDLSLDDAERILQGRVERLVLAPAAGRRVEKARRCLEALMATGA